jgi:hypothetical protein
MITTYVLILALVLTASTLAEASARGCCGDSHIRR